MRGFKLFERVSAYGELDRRSEYFGDKHSPENRVRYCRADYHTESLARFWSISYWQ
jgi:hypothetical protein